GPAVVVVVEYEGREAERGRRLQDPRPLRHVRERAVRVAPVERVGRAAEPGRAAHHGPALPRAVLPGRARRVPSRVLGGQVRGYEQVEAAVTVVVEERA